MTHFNFKMDPY